jgi:phosphohistidine phosphatase
MNRLCLMRHAKAVSQHADAEDRARPLAERGEEAARAVALWMADQGLAPDAVLCSSALRTRQTLAAVLPVLGGKPQVFYEDGLYLADPRALLARLRKVAAERTTVLVVGHNPGLHELAVLLAGAAGGKLARRLRDNLPTAALACFELAGSWTGLGRDDARLAFYVTPKDLARDAE